MIEVRCSICRFPAHLIFDQRHMRNPNHLPMHGWRGTPIVCPVCQRNQHG